jgi:hypothetical protein
LASWTARRMVHKCIRCSPEKKETAYRRGSSQEESRPKKGPTHPLWPQQRDLHRRTRVWALSSWAALPRWPPRRLRPDEDARACLLGWLWSARPSDHTVASQSSVVSPAQRPDRGQPELGSHRPPHLVWHSSPTQPWHL